MSLPAEAIAIAAVRWLELLSRSSIEQAGALIAADPKFSDLSQTQYALAFQWLVDIGEIEAQGHTFVPHQRVSDPDALRRHLFVKAVESGEPPWLADADLIIQTDAELPEDALILARAIGVTAPQALAAISVAQGKVDAQRMAEVGAQGETELVRLLDECWPGRSDHVSQVSDGLGYDVSLNLDGRRWHIEVKATTRRGRLVVYLSRNEFEVAASDPDWRLVVVGMQPNGVAAAVATADMSRLEHVVPVDRPGNVRWQSSRFDLQPEDLVPGLAFVDNLPDHAPPLLAGWHDGGTAWMPGPPLDDPGGTPVLDRV